MFNKEDRNKRSVKAPLGYLEKKEASHKLMMARHRGRKKRK